MNRVTVLSSLALKGVLEKLRPQAELRFDATQAILKRMAQGERADLLILTAEAMEDLRKQGRVTQVRALGSSGVGVAGRAGARRPRIDSPDAFVDALLSASSVAHSKLGASGLYFSGLLKKLKLEERLKKRIIVDKGPVALVVASGEAELGVQMLCELAPVPGIDIIGPLPEPYQVLTHFSAGVAADAANPKGAAGLIDLLLSASTRRVMTDGGLQPVA